jgi:tripartite-type tricarboxylate transporter receptor subunit TctC
MIRLLSIVLATLLLAGAAVAQTGDAGWPDRPIRLIVPFPAGSSTDIVARIVAQKLGQSLGQQIVVENRAGASGNIGADAVAKAAPDGYTIGIATASTHAVAVGLGTNLPYDPIKDFAPVAMLGSQPYVLVLYPGLPAHDLAQLIALAKAKPGALNYGSFGNGTYAHLGMEDFKQRTGAAIVHIPYKGSAPAITALLRNEVSVLIVNEATIDPHVKDGKVRIIAAAGARRAAAFPDLPTIAETVPGFATGSYWGLYGPANLPPAVIDKLRADIGAILTGPEARKLFATNSLEPMDIGAAAFAAFLRRDYEQQGALIKMIGLGE